MDIYTVFAMTMALLGGLAFGVGIVMALGARAAVTQMRDDTTAFCTRILDQIHEDAALRQKIEKALAERVRNLETFRVNHAHRLNTLEDLVDLLNSDGTVEIDHYSEGQGWDRVKVNISDLSESDVTAARPDERSEVGDAEDAARPERSVGDAEVIDVQSEVRSEWDRARVLEDFELDVPACYGAGSIVRTSDIAARPDERSEVGAAQIVERRFLQGL